ncbi:MAG: hypothetical protein ABI461_06615 [Polyangiaceae bacterium]
MGARKTQPHLLATPLFDERPLAALGFIVGAVALGHACQLNNGAYSEDALFWLSLALTVTVVGAIAPSIVAVNRWARAALPWVVVAGLAAEAADLLTKAPGVYLHLVGPNPLAPYMMGIGALIVVAAVGCAFAPPFGRAQIVVLVAGYLWVGAWVLHNSPNPWIDVFVFQRDGSAALLHGKNPYALTFPNIYGNGAYYGPGMVANGRVLFGYVYFPLTLLMVLPGAIFFDDIRFAQLAAVALVALSLGVGGRTKSRLGLSAAALVLLLPRGFFVLEQSWTEPLVLLTLAAVVFSARKYPRFLPYTVGLFFASKQYAVIAAPVALLLLRGHTLRESGIFIGKAVLAGTLVTLPFVLWNPQEFYHSVVELQFYQPFRDDALSLLAWYKHSHGVTPPVSLAFVGALVGCGIALLRLPRSAAGFAAGVALTVFLFVAFNKQAFCNYYFLVSGALLLAAGA